MNNNGFKKIIDKEQVIILKKTKIGLKHKKEKNMIILLHWTMLKKF